MHTARDYNELFEQIKTRFIPFLAVFFVIMFLSYLVLYIIDFVPEPIDESTTESTTESVSVEQNSSDEASFGFFAVMRTVWGNRTTTEAAENNTPTVRETEQNTRVSVENSDTIRRDATPDTLIIDALDRRVDVLNPESNSVSALDAALLKGVVRHPDSADFSVDGNMLIIGHSSYLPNVFNRNFQALNGIQNLTWGDLVRVRSADTEYVYRVERVYEAKATELVVPNSRGEAKLTLATCNTFGAKEDRFIVEAELVETRSL